MTSGHDDDLAGRCRGGEIIVDEKKALVIPPGAARDSTIVVAARIAPNPARRVTNMSHEAAVLSALDRRLVIDILY